MDNGKEETVKGIPYEDELSKYKIADPDPEASGKKHYNFAGWYEDPSGSKPFDWNSTMPAANKVVYAKWVAKQYHVSLDPNGGTVEGTQYSEFNVDLDTILDKTSLFQNTKREGYELVGWFYKNSDGSVGSVYNFGKIEEDVNLIAKWRYPGQVQIVYVADPHGSPAPEDNYLYATDSTVVLAAPPKNIDEGWEFYAWKVGDKKYYPNNTFDIDEDLIEDYDPETKTGKVTVTALYNDKNAGPLAPTSITFDPGKGSGTPVTVDKSSSDPEKKLLVNEKITAKTFDECNFTAPAGYVFKEWNTDEGGEGLSVDPGDEIAADLLNRDKNTTDNTLYAIYEEDEVTIKYAVASDSEGMGTVSPESETVKVINGTASGSTATASGSTYVFDYWTCDDGTDPVGDSAEFVPEKNSDGIYEEHTYYAHFKLSTADVTVHHYLKGTTTQVKKDDTETCQIGNDYTAVPADTYQGKELTVDSYDPSQTITVTAKEDDNVITIYYTLKLKITAKTDSRLTTDSL